MESNRTLEAKTAIITGGARGLGQAICQRLAAEGCNVVVADINEEGAANTAREITETTDRKAIGAQVDITDEAQVEAAHVEAKMQLEKYLHDAGVVKLVKRDRTLRAASIVSIGREDLRFWLEAEH